MSRRLLREATAATFFERDAVSLTTDKPATCSHALAPFPAHLANDGWSRDTNSYWATDVNVSPEAWWQVDLEKPTTVGRVVVVFFHGDPRYYGFTVETSLDGKTWEMAADRRDNRELSTARGHHLPLPAPAGSLPQRQRHLTTRPTRVATWSR